MLHSKVCSTYADSPAFGASSKFLRDMLRCVDVVRIVHKWYEPS
jgi:hypothetical protein